LQGLWTEERAVDRGGWRFHRRFFVDKPEQEQIIIRYEFGWFQVPPQHFARVILILKATTYDANNKKTRSVLILSRDWIGLRTTAVQLCTPVKSFIQQKIKLYAWGTPQSKYGECSCIRICLVYVAKPLSTRGEAYCWFIT